MLKLNNISDAYINWCLTIIAAGLAHMFHAVDKKDHMTQNGCPSLFLS
jgi:hypothetical protein